MKQQIKSVFWNLLLIAVGSIVCAGAINGILIPKQFLSSGVTGLAIFIHYLVPNMPAGLIYFLFNIPLFIVGWVYVGKRFFIYSVIGMTIFSLSLILINIPVPITDKMLSAILAGILAGTGSGLILRTFGSAGGTDILSIIIMKRFSIRLGTTILAFNVLLLFMAAYVFSIETALFTMIYIYVNSRMVDLLVTGLSQRKAVWIISVKWEEISKEILAHIHRGVTRIQAEGGYSGREEKIVYTVIPFQHLSMLKGIIHQIDPDAFVVVSDTSEVINPRIGNQPHW